MSIIRAPRPESNFYILDKRISEDERLSWSARGMLIFLLGKPDHWKVSIEALINCTASAGQRQSRKTAVYAIVAELLSVGYMSRQKHADGTLDYWVHESPQATQKENEPDSDNPDLGNPDLENPDLGNQTLVSIEAKKGLKKAAKKERRATRSDLSFAEWIETCKTSGERPVPESDPVFEYAEKAGLPLDYIVLHWKEFKERYATDGKRYKDWRAVYRKSVRGNWFRLWFFNADGVCTLTTQGQQANRIHKEQA
jgi:hypothetical protein